MNNNPGFSQYRVARSARSLLRRAAPAVLAALLPPIAYAQEKTIAFSIDSQPLPAALLDFGRQADLSVLAPTSLVSGKTAPDVRGQLSVAAALDRLLEGSGLTYIFVQSNAVRIVADDQAALPPEAAPASRLAESGDRVVVTGTNIRGAAPGSSPVDVYTSADIRQSGATTTEQFVARLPQNLGTLTQNGIGASTAGSNLDAVTAIDLRGLGPGTTLTLLNGRRMALSNSGRSADVSFIPLSAIERVEVLTEGASAIYGSDAIGGVVNFILRKDYEGSETRLSYGGVTSGALRQGGASHATGVRWEGGHGLAAYDFHSASALNVADRDYAIAAGPGKLTPTDSRHTLFFAASQALSDALTLDADIGASWRKVKSDHANLSSPVLGNQTSQRHSSQSDFIFGNIGIDYALTDTLNASATASYSAVDTDGTVSAVRFNLSPPLVTSTVVDSRNSQFDLMAKLDGALMALPGGVVRFSAGVGVLDEEYRGVNPGTALQNPGNLGRQSTYAFAEINVPLVAPEQAIPFIHDLSVNVAARYTDYRETSRPRQNRDFGDSLDPKIGVAWRPTPDIRLRATYGSSFRAPALTQLDPAGGAHYLIATNVAGAPSIVLGMSGFAVSDLGPETADSYTLGVDYQSSADDFQFSATYYSIEYTDRIASTPIGGLNPFATPQLLPDLIYRPQSAASIEEALRATRLLLNGSGVSVTDPAAGAAALFARNDVWMYDLRFRNLALSRQDGLDFSIRKGFETALGDVHTGISATHIFRYEQQGSPTSSIVTVVDVPGQPADWKGRAFAGLTNGPFNATLNVNYTDDYANTFAPPGLQKVESWTTVDLALAYELSDLGWSEGSRIGLTVQNVFDEDPPFLRTGSGSNIRYAVGFDPANANPLGRFVLLSLTHAW